MPSKLDPATEAKVQELRIKALELKRKGDLFGARDANTQAIIFDPYRNSLYYNLAKVCYLLNDPKSAISNFMRALHLEINYTATACREAKGMVTISVEGSPALVTLSTFENMIATDFLRLMNSVHQDAKFMSADHTTSLHLGHSVIDLNSKFPKSFEHQSYITLYRSSLGGGKHSEVDPNVESKYNFIGALFALDNLDWSKIQYSDVMNLYSEVPQMRFASLKNFRFK